MAIYSVHHSAIGRSTHAAGTAGAHIRYITREDAQSDHVERMPPGTDTDRTSVKAWIDHEEMADRVNARVVDKLTVALPRELDREQQRDLVRDYCDKLTQCSTPYYAAIHAGPKDADNPHAHIVIRDRDFVTDKRVILTTEKGSTERFREEWETAANRALERAGREERIDRRSLRERGIDREPGRHEGPNVRAMEEREIPTRIGDEARAVRAYNGAMEQERGAVIDFQKAKAELDQEKVIEGRHRDRMKTGTWDEEGSLAVARVEREHGGPVEPSVIRQEAWKAEDAVVRIQRQIQELDDRRRTLEHEGKRAYNEHHAWEKAAALQKRDESLKGKIQNWWNGRTTEDVARTRHAVVEHANNCNWYLERVGHTDLRAMDTEWNGVREKVAELGKEEKRWQTQLDLYEPAHEGHGRHQRAERQVELQRIQDDPQIQARHRERLRSGVWRPEDSEEMSRLELKADGPVTRKWLHDQIVRTPDQDAQVPYDRALSSMDHADELKGYKRDRARHVPGVGRDREIEKELKEIGREVMKELDPERYARQVERTLAPVRDYGRGGR